MTIIKQEKLITPARTMDVISVKGLHTNITITDPSTKNMVGITLNNKQIEKLIEILKHGLE